MKVGFTGTQEGTTNEQFAACTEFFLSEDVSEFHHGACIGADEEIHKLVVIMKSKVYKYPSTVTTKLGKCPGGYLACQAMHPLKRNPLIVDAVDMLLACPKTQYEIRRSGTWATIRYARKVGKPIMIIFPNGEIRKEGFTDH